MTLNCPDTKVYVKFCNEPEHWNTWAARTVDELNGDCNAIEASNEKDVALLMLVVEGK